MNGAIAGHAKTLTGWSIALGIVMIIAGLLAISWPLISGIAISGVVAWLLILVGVAHLLFAWHIRGAGAVLWEVLLGALYIGVAVYMLMHPLSALVALTLVLAAYLLIEGILELVLAFHLRPGQGWGWLLFDGIVTLVLALFIWRSWPSSTEWVIGTLVGISMLFSGITRVMFSVATRSLVARMT
jgi:uncharacterized membrane protein HdeD (DUF308 family)